MKPAIANALIGLGCVAGGALFAFAIASMLAAMGGASLVPMGTAALIGSGALLGLVLAAMSARPATRNVEA